MYSIIQLFNRIFNSVDNEETDRATLSSFFLSSFCNETLCLYAQKKCDPNLKPILTMQGSTLAKAKVLWLEKQKQDKSVKLESTLA